jgi:hypothetical protein
MVAVSDDAPKRRCDCGIAVYLWWRPESGCCRCTPGVGKTIVVINPSRPPLREHWRRFVRRHLIDDGPQDYGGWT